MLRVVISTSAAVRLDAAREFLAGRPPASELAIVGASRGAADDLARDVARRVGATFGLTPLQSHRARGAGRGDAARDGSRGCLARRPAPRRSPRAPSSTRWPPASSRTSRRSRRCRAFRRRSRARCTNCGSRAVGSGVLASWRVGRPGSFADLASLLARVEDELDRAGVDDRAALFRLAAAAVRGGPRALGDDCRSCCSTCRSTRAPSGIRRGAGRALARTCSPRFPTATTSARDALVALGGDHRGSTGGSQTPDFRLQTCTICAGTSSRPTAAGARARRRRAAVLGARRRTRGGRDRPARARRSGARRAVRRDGGLPARAAAVPRPARARLRARRRAGVLRSRHAPSRSGRPRVRRAAVVRGRGPVGEALRRVPVARPGAAGRRAAGRQAARDRRHVPRDEVFADSMSRDGVSQAAREPIADADASRPPIDSDDEAVVAGTLRSPWKWEELIVESAVVGGRTRADGEARWRRRLDGLAADYRLPHRRAEARRAGVARASRASSATSRNLAHLRQFALPIVDALAEWPEQATWGEWLDRFSALAPRALRRPTRVLQTLADLRPMADVGPVTLEEARDVLHDRLVDARLGAAGAALRPAVRRHAASGARPHASASCSCPGSPSASCRSGRARIRCCSTSAAARSTPALVGQERARQRRAAAAEDRDRRGDRAAVSVVSAARRRRDARARAVVLRARRHARDHRARARSPRARGGGGRGRRRQPRVAGAAAIPIARSTISSTTSRSLKPLLDVARSGGGQGARALPARAERGAAAIGDQPLGARTAARGRRATA